MGGLTRVLVVGPLEGYVDGFRADLAALGYSPRTSEAQLYLLQHLSGWLAVRGLAVGDLTPEVVEEFLIARRGRYSNLRSVRALAPLLRYLRGRGAVPAAPVVPPVGAAAVLAERFAAYLSTQRGLAPDTVRSYTCQVRPFLDRYASVEGGWGSLTARQVTDFVTDRAAAQRPRSVAVGANALRTLLRWLWGEQILQASLVDVVGSVAASTGASVPRALSRDQVRDLFAALPATGPVRLRDEAMLALMHRLGLRAGEVASLRLDDIDWRTGVLLVRGKGGRLEQLPVPVDVGKLLAGYLRRGRPQHTAHRQVFLAVDAPHDALAGSAMTSVASRALSRAGIAGPGAAHRLRHTTACRVVAQGGGLAEAGQLLRQASPAATAIYAKADLRMLAVLARPWPAEVTL